MDLLYKKPNVLCILDEFSFNCFKHECNELIPLKQDFWKQQLEDNKIDFLLCESAWNPIGNNFKLGKRKNKNILYNKLKDITDYFKLFAIPTVFWNKEDNKYYNHFKFYAKLFDHIFTTDNRTIKSYKKECPNSKTFNILSFAAQPIIHNPIGINNNKYDGHVLFAGSWYNFPTREKELGELLDLPLYFKLHIYERGFNGKKSKFPFRFKHRIKKGINYTEISKKYKKYLIVLNVNTVKGSLTMYSRRVPEALLSGINVVSSPSLSISKIFPQVFICSTNSKFENIINYISKNKEFREENSHLARRNILKKHTYFNRIVKICKIINIKPPEYKTGVVNLYISSNNLKKKNILLDDIKNQSYQNILCNIEVSNDKYFEKIINQLFFDKILPNGVFNNNIGFIFLLYNGSRYEENYISDMVSSYQYFKNIDIIGKECFYSWKNNKIFLMNSQKENKYTNNVNKHTVSISLKGDKNNIQEKLNYLKNIINLKQNKVHNLKIYSTDKYNFIDT